LRTRAAGAVEKIRRRRVIRRLQQDYYVQGGSAWTPPLPPPSINFNFDPRSVGSVAEYREEYLEAAHTRELPFLRSIASLNSSSLTLDFGCGLGRLAAAYHLAGEGVGHYLGWEPEQRALAWLRFAYERWNRFEFGGTSVPENLNYLTNRGKPTNDVASGAVPRTDEWMRFLDGRQVDLVHSHSVFTHMWPEDAVTTLKMLADCAKDGSTMVHTWLVVDDEAERSLVRGTADRRLPFTVRGIRTYSKDNPLVCTAYPVDLMMDVYASAGLSVRNIHFGSWSGTGRDNEVSYQDYVLSKVER